MNHFVTGQVSASVVRSLSEIGFENMSSKMDVLSEIDRYDYIRFSICDIQGNCRGVVVPRRHAVKSLENGVDIIQGLILFGAECELVEVPHEKDYIYGNVTVIPDIDTLRAIPWAADGQFRVGEFLCESRWRKDGSPQEACPRYVARQQLQRLDDLGLQLFAGFEMEYVLFPLDSVVPVFQKHDYLSHTVMNRFSSTMFKFEQMFNKSGVDISAMHVESSPGAFEAVLSPKYGIESADAAINFKQGILEMAESLNLRASFMTKLYLNSPSTQTHFNHSIQSKHDGISMPQYLLYDSQSEDKLSITARRWLAGILKHSKALTALCVPTPHCYRRLLESIIPTTSSWGIEDRTASVRVKNHGPAHTYFENRLPSGLCNPYIVLAATVAAGLDGVINKLECPAPGKLRNSESLPKTFEDALKALEADTDLMKGLGEEFIAWFLATRRAEIRHFEGLSSDTEKMELERKRYF